jgi:hypothetical protein
MIGNYVNIVNFCIGGYYCVGDNCNLGKNVKIFENMLGCLWVRLRIVCMRFIGRFDYKVRVSMRK